MRSLKFHDSFFVFLTKVEFKIQIELYHVTISCPNAFKIQKKIIIDLNYQLIVKLFDQMIILDKSIKMWTISI